MTRRPRLLVVGWDGVDWDLLRPWIAEGLLPNVRRLAEEGVRARLRAPTPANSFTSWTTFFTGREPGRHGVYGFLEVDPAALARRPYALGRLDAPPLWDVLAAQGLSAGVVNLPHTYPPEAPRGFMVSGILAPEERVHAAPPALEADLRARFPDYRVDFPAEAVPPGDAGDAEFLRRVEALTEGHARLALDLLRRDPPDVFLVVFTGSDRLLHRMRGRAREMRAYFARLDAALGALRAAAGEETPAALVSDHGFGPKRLAVRLNAWLAENGYLALRRPAREERLRAAALGAMGRASRFVRASGLARLRDFSPVRRALAPLDRAFTRLGEEEAAARARAILPGLDPRGTRAYLGGAAEEGVRLRASGREYDALREELIARLSALRDPASGLPVFSAALPREKVFEGPHLAAAPDILLAPNPAIGVVLEERLEGPALLPQDGREGCHRPFGLFAAEGGPFARGRDLGDLAMADALPTLLAAAGAAVPEGLDGRAAEGAFLREPALRFVSPPPRAAARRTVSPEEDAALRAQLAGLGYLE